MMVTETVQPNGNAMELGANGATQESGSKPELINKKKIVITSIIGCLLLGLIILAIVLLNGTPATRGGNTLAQTLRFNSKGVTLDQILDGSLSVQRFNGTFVSDNEILYKNDQNQIVIYDASKNKVQVLFPAGYPILDMSLSYELSADRKYLLVAHTFQKLYRYSVLAHYEIFNMETRKSVPLSWSDGSRIILLAKWAPTGNGLVFVLHNTHDIYYRPAAESPGYRITTTGIPTTIYNGVPDWVNEEEVFSSNVALWFSGDGKKLAYATFNDTLTRVMSIPFYGYPGNLDFQYTRAINIRYPKPGSPNPTVSLFVADLEELSGKGATKPTQMAPPQELRAMEPILSTVAWATNDELSAVWMNRVQNVSIITLCNTNPASQECAKILTLKEPNGWIDLFVPPTFSKDGSQMVLILAQNQGSAGDFRHVCVAERQGDGVYLVTPVTKGNFTVTEVLHFDDEHQKVYYLATTEEHSEQLNLYESPVRGGGAKCVTCGSKATKDERECLYNKAVFSPGNGSFYALSCLGPGVPEVSIYSKDHKKVLTWENNAGVQFELRGLQLPTVERLSVPVPGGFQAQVQLLLPPGLDRSGETKYPLLVNVYGGPDSYQSTEKFNIDWSTYLTTNKNIIYATIDGRGSGLKGNRMLFSIYRRLGTSEIEDQINVTRYLKEKFSFIDKDKSAIWGWSYGGYATGMVLAQDTADVFKCGISVAPVTDWAYYDTIYTERYMGLPRPDDNLRGYARAQLNDKVDNLRDKQYFLIHGTLDDNVHYQQSMMLSKALEQNDILFRQQSYPDEEHGLAGVRPHLYHSLEKFLNDCYATKE